MDGKGLDHSRRFFARCHGRRQRGRRRPGVETSELLGQTRLFKHGSTVATNALITHNGCKVGLITTKGFEDTTEIMRAIGRVDGLSDDEIKHVTWITKPEPFVPESASLACGNAWITRATKSCRSTGMM